MRRRPFGDNDGLLKLRCLGRRCATVHTFVIPENLVVHGLDV
jgi:hypothetical protein